MSKKSERLFQALSDIREETVDEVAEVPKRKIRWKRWVALAAVLAVIIMGGRLLPRMGGSSGNPGAGGGGADGGSTFMSYAGPVFPLTLREENSNITAERDITLDFAPWVPQWVSNEEEAASRDEAFREDVLKRYNEWYPEGGRYVTSDDILVTDAYTLTNSSGTDQTVKILYPFASILRYLEHDRPVLTVDGVETDAVLHAGGYCGSFMGAIGSETLGSLNLKDIESWEGYKAVLADGSYQENALSEFQDLSGIDVIVYAFTNPWGEKESTERPNPSIRIMADMDYDKTTMLTYGFNSGSMDMENGKRGAGFSIPQENSRDSGRSYYFIVLGEDIQNMTIRAYDTGGFDTEKEIEGGVDVQRYETNLDAVLRELVMVDMWERSNGIAEGLLSAGVDREMYYELFCNELTAYGLISENPVERYSDGMLDSMDFYGEERVFYLEAEVTIPANGTVTVCAEIEKSASYDFFCAHTENQGVSGYDMVTELGSNLSCGRQTARLEDRGQIEIVRQNFGFHLETGVKTVSLLPEQEHYYLEVKRAGE